MPISVLTISCFLLALFVRHEAFLSCSSRRISGGFTLHVGTSPYGSPRTDKPKKPRALGADGDAKAENELEDVYKKKTVVQLRVLLKERSLKLSGLKSELVERLKQSDSAAGVLQATDYEALSIACKSTDQ